MEVSEAELVPFIINFTQTSTPLLKERGERPYSPPNASLWSGNKDQEILPGTDLIMLAPQSEDAALILLSMTFPL